MPRQNTLYDSINGAARFLRNADNRKVRITLADVAEPVTLIAIQNERGTIYARTNTGDNVEFLLDDVRMVAYVSMEPVGPEMRDAIAMEEARKAAQNPRVQQMLGREYQRIRNNNGIVSEIVNQAIDADLADGAEEGETPEQTFIRLSLYNQMMNAWEPFVERIEWANRVVGAYGYQLDTGDQDA